MSAEHGPPDSSTGPCQGARTKIATATCRSRPRSLPAAHRPTRRHAVPFVALVDGSVLHVDAEGVRLATDEEIAAPAAWPPRLGREQYAQLGRQLVRALPAGGWSMPVDDPLLAVAAYLSEPGAVSDLDPVLLLLGGDR